MILSAIVGLALWAVLTFHLGYPAKKSFGVPIYVTFTGMLIGYLQNWSVLIARELRRLLWVLAPVMFCLFAMILVAFPLFNQASNVLIGMVSAGMLMGFLVAWIANKNQSVSH